MKYAGGYDYVKISYGNFSQNYCGNSGHGSPVPLNVPFISSGTTMTVEFHSDQWSTSTGFFAIICCGVNVTTDVDGDLDKID